MNEKEYKNGMRLTHEYFLLAESHGKLLKKEHKDQLWSWIMNGANEDAYDKRKSISADNTEDEVQKYIKFWHMHHLMPFRKIDSKWKEYFDSLVKELGEPNFPSFKSWMEAGSWGNTTAISAEQLKRIEPTKIIEFLESWEPIANDPLDRSRDATGRVLTEGNPPVK
jgi:hypothetical protein